MSKAVGPGESSETQESVTTEVYSPSVITA